VLTDKAAWLQNDVEAFKLREKAPGYKDRKPATVDKVPQFLNGRMLRDYQVGQLAIADNTSSRW